MSSMDNQTLSNKGAIAADVRGVRAHARDDIGRHWADDLDLDLLGGRAAPRRVMRRLDNFKERLFALVVATDNSRAIARLRE